MAGGLVTSRREGDGFAGPGGHSANLEAWRSFLRGSWRLCTPSLLYVYIVEQIKSWIFKNFKNLMKIKICWEAYF